MGAFGAMAECSCVPLRRFSEVLRSAFAAFEGKTKVEFAVPVISFGGELVVPKGFFIRLLIVEHRTESKLRICVALGG